MEKLIYIDYRTMPITCISCHVVFTSTALQRDHYKGDWHRYNLMRKVAELPPVTSEEFDLRAKAQKESAEDEQAEGHHCQLCRKYFSSKNAYDNHLKSKRHLESLLNKPQEPDLPFTVQEKNRKNVVKSLEAKIEDLRLDDEDEDSDWESVAEDSFEVTKCLFCSEEWDDIESNVKHMSVSHSFFLPDLEYLTDLSGLIAYLGSKTSECFICLWCDKAFHQSDAVQKHMVDKGHCKMRHEGETLLEYADFYDYTTSYPDDGAEDVIPDVSLEGDEWQLVLPSGVTVGHRSLNRYYRQNLRPERPAVHGRSQKAIHRLMHEYRSLGWKETPERLAQRNARDIRFMKKVADKQQLRLGQKANRFQPHFRPQVVF